MLRSARMRWPAFLLVPTAVAFFAPNAAFAQEGFGAEVVRADPYPPPVWPAAHTHRDPPVMRRRSSNGTGWIAGGVVLGAAGLGMIIGGAVLIRAGEEADKAPGPCSTSPRSWTCGLSGLGGLGRGMEQGAGWMLALLGGSAVVGGISLIVTAPAPERAKGGPAWPEVSLSPRSMGLRWTF